MQNARSQTDSRVQIRFAGTGASVLSAGLEFLLMHAIHAHVQRQLVPAFFSSRMRRALLTVGSDSLVFCYSSTEERFDNCSSKISPLLATTPNRRKPSSRGTSRSRVVTLQQNSPVIRSASKHPGVKLASDKARDRLKDASSVGVYLRLRPLKVDEPTILRLNEQQVQTNPPDGANQQIYSFTQVFDNAPQSVIFDKIARPVVEDAIVSAKDGLIFAYGITGSGKTYTMEGLKSDPGLIYRTIDFVFNSIGAQQTQKSVIESDGHNSYCLRDKEPLYPTLGREDNPSALPSVIKWQNRTKESSSVTADPNTYYTLFISLVELYNKQVHDLFEEFDTNTLEKKRREIRTDQRGISYVANVVEVEVKSADEAVEYYTRGVRRRRTASTALNQESSRGHCVLNLRLVQIKKSPYDHQFDEDTLVASQLCLVDLAGSERTKRTGATGGALQEAGNINNSLGALRKCIRALRDREPTNNIHYREYSLTRLFKSYFEGHGSVRMVLCVKPTSADFYENNIAMEFGLLTQEVPIDYASPPKMIKRSRSKVQEPNFLLHYDIDPELTDEEFIAKWIDRLKTNKNRRRRYVDSALATQKEVRVNILKTFDNVTTLQTDISKITHLLKGLGPPKIERHEWTHIAPTAPEVSAPSAPEMEPFQSSSPVGMPNPSTTETTDSNSAPTMTNSSSEAIEYQVQKHHEHQHEHQPNIKQLSSPNRGIPIVNPRHNRSLSCSSMQWIHHKPQGTIDTGTVLKPKFKNGRSVKNLRTSDILRKDAAGYSVVHQDADLNGDVETSIFKGHIVSTVCGGAQVILDDIETMRQVSPKRRRRAASDATFTH